MCVAQGGILRVPVFGPRKDLQFGRGSKDHTVGNSNLL